MIRVVIYLIAIGVMALGAAWLAERPGDVAITWQGWRLDTSVMVMVMVVAAVAALAVALWSLLRAIWRAPRALRQHRRARRNARGYLALSQGLIAVGSGDVRAARKFADEAGRIAPGEPLTLLLSAQSAQLAGDRPAAEHTFQAMAQRPDTKLLGLHGLFIEAQRRQDAAAAILFAEEAANTAAPPAWAGHAVLQFRCAAGDWTGALERLDRNMASGLLDKAAYRRQRAVLLTARALAAESAGDRAGALALALEAVGLAPTLVPAAALAGRLSGEAGELRKAARIVDIAWKANPHPDLADTFAHLRPGDSARDRLARIQALAQKTPADPEGALAVARAALDAREFAIARSALAPFTAAPTQRVAMLMARLERLEHGDEGRAREWMTRALNARRDPAWTADGVVSDRWMPVSPVTGRLDAFVWKEPLEELGGRTLIDSGDEPAALAPPPEPVAEPAPAPEPIPVPAVVMPPPRIWSPSAPPEPEEAPIDSATAAPARGYASTRTHRPHDTIIPLIHAPRRSGPGRRAAGGARHQPRPETPPQADGWNRLRQLFK